MTQITADKNASPPTMPPMIAVVGILMLLVELRPEVVGILDGGKFCVEGAKDSNLVPPSTRNTSNESMRTLYVSDL
jgi:xanthosine utilization system XapX-like protein